MDRVEVRDRERERGQEEWRGKRVRERTGGEQ